MVLQNNGSLRPGAEPRCGSAPWLSALAENSAKAKPLAVCTLWGGRSCRTFSEEDMGCSFVHRRSQPPTSTGTNAKVALAKGRARKLPATTSTAPRRRPVILFATSQSYSGLGLVLAHTQARALLLWSVSVQSASQQDSTIPSLRDSIRVWNEWPSVACSVQDQALMARLPSCLRSLYTSLQAQLTLQPPHSSRVVLCTTHECLDIYVFHVPFVWHERHRRCRVHRSVQHLDSR